MPQNDEDVVVLLSSDNRNTVVPKTDESKSFIKASQLTYTKSRQRGDSCRRLMQTPSFSAQREKTATSPSLQASASMMNANVHASMIRKSMACSERSSSVCKEHHSVSEVCTAASQQTVSG